LEFRRVLFRSEIDDVYSAQLELVGLAGGRPTFQWIESGTMDCGARGGVVTPTVIRAESWLAVAAGAHGLGFFPGEWTPANAAAVAAVTGEVKAVAPALVQPTVPAAADPPLRVAAHSLADALYVVAVNPTRRTLAVAIRLPELHGRTLRPLGLAPPLQTRGDTATGRFPPLGAGVYVAAPE